MTCNELVAYKMFDIGTHGQDTYKCDCCKGILRSVDVGTKQELVNKMINIYMALIVFKDKKINSNIVSIEDYQSLLKRFQHLLESDVIALYDEVDPITKRYKRDVKELDRLFNINKNPHDFICKKFNVPNLKNLKVKPIVHKHKGKKTNLFVTDEMHGYTKDNYIYEIDLSSEKDMTGYPP
jgi:hypothetical protein